jgi:hypothetical protein
MNNNWLQNCRKNIKSQRGEDGILLAIFDKIGVKNRWCIECGASDGSFFSNTWNLINNCGWSSVQIESDWKKYIELVRLYADNENIICLSDKIGITSFDGFDSVLNKTTCPVMFDLCVIDIDGNDYWTWLNMVTYQPNVVMIEFNPTIPFWEIIIQDVTSQIQLGSSLSAMVMCGNLKQYELVAVTEFNAFFVKKELFPKLGIEDNSIWQLAQHTVKNLTWVYQSYDNKVNIGGLKRRMWNKKEIITNNKIEIDMEK